VHPWESIRLEAPRLELRVASVAELRELAALARAGIHDPAEMPFRVAWTDRARLPSFEEEFLSVSRIYAPRRSRTGARFPPAPGSARDIKEPESEPKCA